MLSSFVQYSKRTYCLFMKKLLIALFVFVFLAPLYAGEEQYNGSLKIYDSTGRYLYTTNFNGIFDFSPLSLQNGYGLDFSHIKVGTGTPITLGPPPPPPPPPTPVAPSAPPAAVTNCPNLAFSDNFAADNTTFYSSISKSGPLTGNLKWITQKADGYGYSSAAYFQPPSPGYYMAGNGYATVNLLNWIQTKSNSAYKTGMGQWYAGALGTAAYANGGAVNGQSTGFLKAPPFYWEIAVWVPPLAPSDAANLSGLWPSIAFYTDPAIGTAEAGEIDLFEMYSIDYTIPHCSTHLWASGKQIGGYASNVPPQPDLSAGWHVWGLWVDVTTTHFYLDGVEIYSCPTPNNVPANTPWYMVIADQAGGPGWTICLDPSHPYSMKLAYAKCWAP